MALPDRGNQPPALEQKTIWEEVLKQKNKGLRRIFQSAGTSFLVNSVLYPTSIYSSILPEAEGLKVEANSEVAIELVRGRYSYVLELSKYVSQDYMDIQTEVTALSITRLDLKETPEQMIARRQEHRRAFNKGRPSIHVVEIEKTIPPKSLDDYGPMHVSSETTILRQGRVYRRADCDLDYFQECFAHQLSIQGMLPSLTTPELEIIKSP